MNQVSKAYDGEGLEWLYTHSRNYPLLSAEEERDIDKRKWQTRDVLLEALLTDVRSRFFLKQWVSIIYVVSSYVRRRRLRKPIGIGIQT